MTATPTAAERAAAFAWALAMRDEDAMPPWAARDYVMDHTGDRDAAVSLLCHAAADWLMERHHHGESWEYPERNFLFYQHLGCGRVCEADMWLAGFGSAQEWRDHGKSFEPLARWCDDADRALAACRAMTTF